MCSWEILKPKKVVIAMNSAHARRLSLLFNINKTFETVQYTCHILSSIETSYFLLAEFMLQIY